MPIYRYGGQRGKAYELNTSDDYMVVRTSSRKSLFSDRPYEAAAISPQSRRLLSRFDRVTQFRAAGVEVLRTKTRENALQIRDEARKQLKAEDEVQFAGRVLVEPSSQCPVIYTENLFIKFQSRTAESTCQELIERYGLSGRPIDFTRNAYFLRAAAGTGAEVFELSEQLLSEGIVELCHPELIRHFNQRQVQGGNIQANGVSSDLPKAFTQQWHLASTTIENKAINASANVTAAWPLSQGNGVTIAVIDDGFDLEHEEFSSPGKIIAPRDATKGTNDPRPGRRDNHGTACAGVACGDGRFGATGVAPKAKLMPIRLTSGLGSIAEAEAFAWATRNGADIISCSWGPPDGAWFDKDDPLHNRVVPLPDSTRLAMEFALEQGRDGKGCVICWAAGNGNELADNDGYASFEKVIAVAACNDMNTRSAYSDYGDAIWCAFPSNNGEPSLTNGIWTADRSGNGGYNWGSARLGDEAGNYTNSFGGTSSACPGVAGVAALILARNPQLRWEQVKDVIKQSCDRIDEANGNYNDQGHSQLYGYGRINALKAVERAAPAVQTTPVLVNQAVRDITIQDLRAAQLSLTVAETAPLLSLKVAVDLDHTYIGDLVITLQPPESLEIEPIKLHNRAGGGRNNIKQTYDSTMVPQLAQLEGKIPTGIWSLEVRDLARWDNGVLHSFALEMEV